jgi:hypothetical protein
MSYDTFIADVRDATHPVGTVMYIWQRRAVLEIHPADAEDRVHLALIMALHKGRGDGGRALRWICALADRHQVTLVGHIERGGDTGLSTRELRRWYKRHGFHCDRQLRLTRRPAGEGIA